MFVVNKRRVKVVTGRRTQTVNVCTAAGRAGEYDYIIRLHPPFTSEQKLVYQQFGSIEQLVEYLTDDLGGEIERVPGMPAGRPLSNKAVPADLMHVELSAWGLAARSATERAIDALVEEFIDKPYLHRVEHSLHCRLYELMAGMPELHAEIQFDQWSTQPIHKEWPEYNSRPEKGNRRGNFDLVVLSPDVTAGKTLEAFRRGTVRPSIVIEMGLDYRLDHLAGDVHKLQNSGVRDSYIIHLVRQGIPDDYDAVESLVLSSGFKTAYVRHMNARVRYKLLGDNHIRDVNL